MSEELDEQLARWQIGDYAIIDDFEFKVFAIIGKFLMVDNAHGYKMEACQMMATSECRYCNKQKPRAKQERYSFSVYAGKMCDDCAYRKYRDHCGLDGSQGDPQDLEEPEDYYSMGRDLAEFEA